MARKKPVDGPLLSLRNRLKTRGPKALQAWAGKHPETLDPATVRKMAGAASDGRDPLLAEAAAVLAGVVGDAALEAECLLTAGGLRGAVRQSARASRQLRLAFDLYLGLRDFGNAAAALEAEVDAWIRAGRYERGFRCGLGLLERIAAQGDASGMVEACVRLAWCLFGYGGYEETVTVCEAAAPHAASVADPGLLARLHYAHATALSFLEWTDRAIPVFQLAREHAEKHGDPDLLARVLLGEAKNLEFYVERHPEARALLNRAATLFRQIKDRESLSEVDFTRRRLYEQRRMQEKHTEGPPPPLPWAFGGE